MKQTFVEKRFSQDSMELIVTAENICEEYDQQGYVLTLRQLYYQLVARDFIPNTIQSYKRVGSIINDARLAGLLDWNHLEDRTRNVSIGNSWESPKDIIYSAERSYKINLWNNQECYVEVWVEKEALISIIETICGPFRVPTFACRGYVSQSEMYGAADRFLHSKENYILHLGDHDPSGIDMTRDIQDRLNLFEAEVEVKRLALNMDQVRALRPPPNPAKATDARFASYRNQYGAQSWELDALEPSYLDTLLSRELNMLVDQAQWDADKRKEEADRDSLRLVREQWEEVEQFIRK